MDSSRAQTRRNRSKPRLGTISTSDCHFVNCKAEYEMINGVRVCKEREVLQKENDLKTKKWGSFKKNANAEPTLEWIGQ